MSKAKPTGNKSDAHISRNKCSMQKKIFNKCQLQAAEAVGQTKLPLAATHDFCVEISAMSDMLYMYICMCMHP